MGRQRTGGEYEVAYGHHLLTALREIYPDSYKIPIEIRKLSDSEMLKIMARENMEQWATTPLIQMETVAAVIDAYDKGEIQLEAPKTTTGGAVSYTGKKRPYTAQTVAKFLGWVMANGGKPITGIVKITNGNSFLWKAYLQSNHLKELARRTTYEQKITTYTERGWLTVGELNQLSRRDFMRLVERNNR